MSETTAEVRWRTALSTIGFLVNVTLCLVAFVKGMHFEGTSSAIRDAEHGQQIAIAAVPGVVASLIGRRRSRVGMIAAIAAAVLAAIAVVVWLLGVARGLPYVN